MFGQSVCEKGQLFENFWHFFSPITYSISLPETEKYNSPHNSNKKPKHENKIVFEVFVYVCLSVILIQTHKIQLQFSS